MRIGYPAEKNVFLPDFVHGQGQKSEQKRETKKLVEFHNHLHILSMGTHKKKRKKNIIIMVKKTKKKHVSQRMVCKSVYTQYKSKPPLKKKKLSRIRNTNILIESF